jgi:UDP-N-acetylglucosamine 2-epimerase
VHVVGNTVVDAALHYAKIAYEKSGSSTRYLRCTVREMWMIRSVSVPC